MQVPEVGGAVIRLVCPVDASHGPVLPVKDPESRYGWHCPHQAHDGRLDSHPQGRAPRTRAFFTTDEVTSGQLAPESRPRLDDSARVLGVAARDRAEPEAPDLAGRDSLDLTAAVPPGRGGYPPTDPTTSSGRRVAARSTRPERVAGLDLLPGLSPGIPTPGG